MTLDRTDGILRPLEYQVVRIPLCFVYYTAGKEDITRSILVTIFRKK